jgi:hypothetical protein
MKATLHGATLLFLLVLAGCATNSIYRGVYEGVRVRSQLDSAPAESIDRPELPADYQQYDALRKERSMGQKELE